MTDLLTLSTELLIQVFVASGTIFDALRLSAANCRLHDVWLEHSTQIIEAVLKASTLAHREAINLAVTEIQLRFSMHEKPSLPQCLPTLLQNADLCASACSAYSAFCGDDPSPQKSYYFLRRVGLGYEYHQTRDNLYVELRAMSRDALLHPAHMSNWLLVNATLEEQKRQGVHEEDYHPIYDIYKYTESKWDYADYCISNGAIGDIVSGGNNLPTTIRNEDIR